MVCVWFDYDNECETKENKNESWLEKCQTNFRKIVFRFVHSLEKRSGEDDNQWA